MRETGLAPAPASVSVRSPQAVHPDDSGTVPACRPGSSASNSQLPNMKTCLEPIQIADSIAVCDHGAVERCEVVTDFHRLQELWPQWQRLWESDCRAEIFQTPEFARAWWRAFGRDCSLCTIVVFAGDEVIGILPLIRRGRSLQFLGMPEADYADILCEESRAPEVLALALQALLNSVTGWEECSFEHLSRHSRLVRYFQTLPRQIRTRLRCVRDERQQTIILRNQRDAVFQSLLGKNHTRRLKNKLSKAGRLQFRHLSELEAERHLGDFFRHHIRRHAALGRKSLCASSEFCEFVLGLIQELGPTDRIRFGVLELNGQPLAWDFGFQVNGKFLLYQHTFDLDAWHYSPGEVLLWNELRYAKDHVSREFDFGKGDELYKDRFANYSRETFSMFLEPLDFAGKVRYWKRTVQSVLQPGFCRAKEIVKNHGSILRTVRSVRTWALGTLGSYREAKSRGASLQWGMRAGREFFGNAILSKKTTDVFAFNPEYAQAQADTTEDHSGVQVGQVQLGDLVDLAWAQPHILCLKDLPLIRKRLKNGDRVYVARGNSQVLLVCWVSVTPQDGANSDPASDRMGTSPAFVIEECWSANDENSAAAYRRLFALIAGEASQKHADLLVHCGSHQAVLRAELQRLGFRPKFHSIRYRILHHFRRQSVSRHTNKDPQPPAVV